MPYDLYGTYYASRREAENAEMAQCAAIDADITRREVEELRRELDYMQQPTPMEELINELQTKIKILEGKVEQLENRFRNS